MAFVKTEEWWKYRMKNIADAVEGTKKDLESHKKNNSDPRIIRAHEDQLRYYDKLLIKTVDEFQRWKENESADAGEMAMLRAGGSVI